MVRQDWRLFNYRKNENLINMCSYVARACRLWRSRGKRRLVECPRGVPRSFCLREREGGGGDYLIYQPHQSC